MAKAPAVKKKTAAQTAAGIAFAAGGRAAQAKKRAAAKKAGKSTVTKAQHQAALKWAAAGRAAQAAKKSGKVVKKAAAAVAPEELESDDLLPGWSVGCNDQLLTCAATAMANHMLAATGFRMMDWEILQLHRMAGGDNGAVIASVLEALQTREWKRIAVQGRLPVLASFTRTDEELIVAGLVVGVTLPHARHAVVSCPGGMISWGKMRPWAGVPYEAWALEWS